MVVGGRQRPEGAVTQEAATHLLRDTSLLIDSCLVCLDCLGLALPYPSTLMQRYALRIDVGTEGFREKLSEWLSDRGDAFIVAYEEAGDNKHVHIILDSRHAIKAVRSSFVRTFPLVTGNKGYSLKRCDDDWAAYIRYICKGVDKDTPPVIWIRQGLHYTDEVIAESHAKYWVNNAAIKENAAKRVKVEGATIVEQLERICKEKKYKAYERKEIALEYMRLFRDARKGINVFAARAVVNTVCLLLENPEVPEQAMAMKIADL